uniref:Leishmanolysin-like peptidase n=1 Tax=Trichobilharzia regenti TaxID=157069 RepID=A0AA85KM07_TRIRE|nr:unnamed protein product [Trichobilharzia regenti]
MNLFATLILLLAISNTVTCKFICGNPDPTPLQHTIEVQQDNTVKRSAQPASLKFYITYLDGFNQLQESQRIKTLVEDATRFWERALTVKNPGTGKQLVKRYCSDNIYYTVKENNSLYCVGSRCNRKATCGPLEVPDEYTAECFEQHHGTLYRYYHNGSGIPANGYVLIVDAGYRGACSGSTAAYAGPCHMDPVTDRPNVGYVNLCPGQMDLSYPGGKSLPGIIIHEIGHALGFLSNGFPFMRDSKGNPRTKRGPDNKPIYKDRNGNYLSSNNTVKMITRNWLSAAGKFTRTPGSFVTPKILAFARKYFACPNLDGVDLENYNVIGAVGSHWEARLFQNEVLSPVILIDYSVSQLTLAFFDDSGWYNVNYKTAMRMEYGKGLGCNFATKSCFEYAEIQRRQQKSFKPFCDDNRQATCKDTYSYGVCHIYTYPSGVPREDQFFKTPPYSSPYSAAYFGGDDPHRDFCPTQTYVSGLGDYTATSFCTHTENIQRSQTGTNYYLQTYGKNSICLNHRGKWIYSTHYNLTLTDYLQGSCHKYECTRDKKLNVYFKSAKVSCQRSGEVQFSVRDGNVKLTGAIVCPNPKIFCK